MIGRSHSGFRLEWGRLELPLARPLPVRGQSLCRRSLLRLRLGRPGHPDCWAEAAPLPGLHRETCITLERWLEARRGQITDTLERWLAGTPDALDPPDWPAGCAPSLLGALDRLAQSVVNRDQGRRDWQLPGLGPDARITLAPLVIGSDAEWRLPPGPEPRILKVKLDPHGLDTQLGNLASRVQRLEDQGQRITVRLDPNRRLDLGHLDTLARGLQSLRVQWIEDPCLTAQASREFCDRAGLALALDELLPASLAPEGQADFLAALRPAALVLKPGLLGGFRQLAAWSSLARTLGCDTVFSSCFESPWGLGRLAAWAALLAPDGAHGLGTAGYYRDSRRETSLSDSWTLAPGDLPAGPGQPWLHCTRWSTRRTSACLASLPGLRGRLPLMDSADTPPISPGSRVDLRLDRQTSGECSAIALLGLLDHGCSVFPQDGSLPVGLLEERAAAAGCSHRLEVDTGRWQESGRSAGPTLPSGMGPLVMVSTGGSSGRTRIVIHSLRSLLAGASGALAAFPFGPGDGWLLALPLCHVGGLSVLFRCLLGGGRALHPLPGESLADSLQRLRPSHLSLVPSQLAVLLEQQASLAVLRASRLVRVGGAPLPETLRRRALGAGVPVAASWGLTETGGQVSTAWPDRAMPDGRFSSGWTLPGRQVRVRNGELQVRGTALCEGWIQNGSYRVCGSLSPWFPSGDLGELDHTGAVRVRGRRQRLLISGGENLYPEDIECVLEQHPGIRRACVLAVDHPRWGQRPVAVIQPAGESGGLPGDLLTWLDHRLPRIARPDAWWAWPGDLSGSKTPWGELARRLERGELDSLALP